MTITEQLAAAIAAAKIPADELPRRCRVNEATIRNIRKGRPSTAVTADKIAAALGMRWQLVPIEETGQ
jgi:hypothetical protein